MSGSSAQPILNYKAMNGAAYDVRAPPPAPLAVQCSAVGVAHSLVPRGVLSLPIYKTVSRSFAHLLPLLRLRQALIGKDTAGSMGCAPATGHASPCRQSDVYHIRVVWVLCAVAKLAWQSNSIFLHTLDSPKQQHARICRSLAHRVRVTSVALHA